MGSLTYNDTGKPIAYDEDAKDIIYYSNKKGIQKAIGKFIVLPELKDEFDIVYVIGMMGSGKSYFCAEYAKNYKKIYPKNKVFLFSQKKQDKTFDDEHKDLNLEKVKLDEEFLDKEIDINDHVEYHNSLLIFDDFMHFSNKKILSKICNLILQCITLGRQFHMYICITSHLFYYGCNRELYMNIQNEVKKLVWFRGANKKQLRYVLGEYYGYDKSDSLNIINFDKNSRFTCLLKFPQILISRNKIITLE